MKKNDILILFAFFFTVVFFSFYSAKASMPLMGKTIYLDIGHGGVDPGSIVGKIYEKDINLAIGKALEEELIKLGATVYMIREGDYDLGSPNATYRKKSDFDQRIKLINESNADMYISIHLNFLEDSRYSGPQVFYNKKDEKNESIAAIIQEELNTALKKDRDYKKIPNATYMYDKIEIPGVLVECGFLSNSTERNKLISETYQKEFAKYLANAIAKFY